MENNYYVYEWIRLDTLEPFYVGKGKGKRYKETHRNNPKFNEIIKNYPTAVSLLETNLTEEEAFQYEIWYIYEYRDIIGYDLLNKSDGGKSTVLSGKDNHFSHKRFVGSLNGMYGKKHKPETIEKIKSKLSGENSPFYGKKRPEHSLKISGKNHPLYGKKHSEESKKKMSESSKNKPNARSRKIRCITTGKEFNFVKEGANYYNLDDSSLHKHLKGKYKYCGKTSEGEPMFWEYID